MKPRLIVAIGETPDQPPSGGCVLKPKNPAPRHRPYRQPPSGGCVLKPRKIKVICQLLHQPPSGGCVLKPFVSRPFICCRFQPPSGGCVLKLPSNTQQYPAIPPAAFRRLCVETCRCRFQGCSGNPAAFRRLCVETRRYAGFNPCFGPSRLQAAVC